MTSNLSQWASDWSLVGAAVMVNMSLGEWLIIVLAALNWFVCSAIGYACLCRMRLMSRSTTKLHFRAGYTVLMACATISGWEWLLSWLWIAADYPINPWAPTASLGQLALASAALFVIGSGYPNWRVAVPDYARSDVDDFDSVPDHH